jgi:hypothetical protein
MFISLVLSLLYDYTGTSRVIRTWTWELIPQFSQWQWKYMKEFEIRYSSATVDSLYNMISQPDLYYPNCLFSVCIDDFSVSSMISHWTFAARLLPASEKDAAVRTGTFRAPPRRTGCRHTCSRNDTLLRIASWELSRPTGAFAEFCHENQRDPIDGTDRYRQIDHLASSAAKGLKFPR